MTQGREMSEFIGVTTGFDILLLLLQKSGASVTTVYCPPEKHIPKPFLPKCLRTHGIR